MRARIARIHKACYFDFYSVELSTSMYHDYFGFEQTPFSIAPDPDFLYLGPRHQEGLEHLRQGLSGSGGFLLLTGEVGTGKTTLSRAVLAELQEHVDVAFVLNPMLSERELLATICDQFAIPGRHEKASLKRLTDHLSRFLQEASAQGRQPVVLIDEAQHLLPSVLEQLRLLTNLETNSRKLLSVVLIGQPELQTLLQRRELRQVAQRIVARYHLLPLTEKETQAYIQHRLQCVGGDFDIFEAAALKQIFRFSQGTPRLINLVADRALQLAARQETRKVSKAIVAEAAESLSFSVQRHQESRGRVPWATVFTSVSVVAVIAAAALWWRLDQTEEAETARLSEQRVQQEQQRESASREVVLTGLSPAHMLRILGDRWQVQNYISGIDACAEIPALNLACVRGHFTAEQLVRLDLPAVLESRVPELWLMLNGIETTEQGQHRYRVADRYGVRSLSENELQRNWSGEAIVFWQLPTESNFEGWVREGVQEYLPYSLRSASLAQQLEWLRASLGRLVNSRLSEFSDDELTDIELAYLSSGYFTNRPSLQRPQNVQIPQGLVADDDRTTLMAEISIPLERRTKPVSSGNTSGERVTTASADTQTTPPNPDVASEEVSSHIRNLFDSAVAEIGIDDVLRNENQAAVTMSLPFARDLSRDERQQLPRFNYDSHMYSGRTRDRWIRLNDRMLREGERMGELRVIAIEPSHTVFGYRDILFRLDALEDLNF
ncbi:AAA family ATPase [Aliidiomarina halalkaliphila]|uniref:AAA family ATPase n=1 Tax=Aliidiomarina halalkaliphila TaxID=2593535 RepID=A0A552WYP8_9GAMM|nr:AAA family ATPase [Aliidiomarina halalkaliphila]TRW47940.1 AAA family ATPase [Aliidiomarina halalkaliphila]